MSEKIKKIIKGLAKKHRTSIGNSVYSRPNHKRRRMKKPYVGQGRRR